MKIQIIDDASFESEFNAVIEPFCAEYEKSDYFTSFDGRKIHYLSYINNDAKAAVLIMHGFTEFAEKFREMSYYFFNEGYTVFSYDMRGHGLSYKDEAPEYGVHSRGFHEYSRDTAVFIKDVISKENLPLYIWSHSLGGNVSILTLMDNPDIKAEKLVLSSPMICGNMGMPVKAAKIVSGFMNKVGRDKVPAPGKCEFHPENDNKDAESVERGRFATMLRVNNPEYQTMGPTFAWVYSSIFAKERLLNPDNYKKLKTDILLIKPEKDEQLLEKPQDEFVSICQEKDIPVRVEKIPGTCHEIFQSKTPEMEIYLNMILDFFSE